MVLIGFRDKSQLGGSVTIRDRTIVLLKKGETSGAFILTRESRSPEVVDYKWFLRNDGKSTFDTNDPNCSSGIVKNATGITFGPFKIQWSSNGGWEGYLYYPLPYWWVKMPWGKYWGMRNFHSPSMAITTETNLSEVDANDPRWKFKNGPWFVFQ